MQTKMNLIVTDTFEQVNGVSTTYKNILKLSPGQLHILHPGMFKWTSFSVYPEVQICTEPVKVWKTIKELTPTHVHIATEGVMGVVARTYCEYHNVPYTTAYHTKFPDFLYELAHVPKGITWAFLRWFHKHATAVLTTTETMCMELYEQRITNAVSWTRGVDVELFGQPRTEQIQHEKPVLVSVGRVSREKNLDAFCKLDTNKFQLQLVGDGPYLEELKQKYPNVEFLGYKHGYELGQIYANADCMVFTSLTDTFGLVMIESMSMGTPVAAYPVTGPTDAITHGTTGFYYEDLNKAINECLSLDRDIVAVAAHNKWSWQQAHDIFMSHVN